MMEDPYVRFARLARVIDGDTVDMCVDLGWGLTQKVRFRLLGVDTPELRSSDPVEREAARAAAQFTLDTLDGWSHLATDAHPLWVESRKTGKYGRWLARIGTRDAQVEGDLNDLLLAEGHGKPYVPRR